MCPQKEQCLLSNSNETDKKEAAPLESAASLLNRKINPKNHTT